ncbi:hypothetical protein COY90_01125 [Candidatus Roizmanbacteria bacterium CG_4_10_14_0_8_um_filter_39_9]|uniref:Uncharacterized protein n=1 Tax=Candidatus Roizmanbacteria bacterium CG_4_10_14_0_8_um_filter_39_9 TaxID=1974829 RepID=A0A2M7QDQ4_9BACT|nr:MAG: hypothetical protein COY90_01125 [Candidatus Roizmanbacteria bacterium CG_4_10_14_0_8_um_filter_39_9]
MIELTSAQNEKKSFSCWNKPIMKIGILTGGLIILGATFWSGLIFGKNLQTGLQPTQQLVYQPSATKYMSQMIRIYPSLNNHFLFYVYPTGNSEKCLYGIRDKQGYEYDVSEVLGEDRITCSEGQGNLSSSFISWAEGDKFIINEKEGEINIVDVRKFEAETYKYDTVKYKFEGAAVH